MQEAIRCSEYSNRVVSEEALVASGRKRKTFAHTAQ